MDLWALARFDLGLADEEFGDLSYAMFESLLDRKKARMRFESIQTAVIAATIVNTSFDHPDTPVEIKDFLPDEPEENLSQLTPEEQAAKMISQFSKKTYSKR